MPATATSVKTTVIVHLARHDTLSSQCVLAYEDLFCTRSLVVSSQVEFGVYDGQS